MKMIRRITAMLAMIAMLFSAWAFAETLPSVQDVEIPVVEPGWWNILLLGGDSRDLERFERTDTMIILSVNREESLMKLTSIMRDTWVQFSSGSAGKINAANVYGGPEMAMKVVNNCFGTDIEHYILINMNGLAEVIDMLGGVDLTITESEREYVNKYARDYLKHIADYSGETYLGVSGDVHLNGLLSVSYLRNRYSDSDFGRVMRQQKVLLAAADKAQAMEVNALMEMADDVFARIKTNMTNEQMKEIAMAGLVTEIEDVAQFRIPADGTYESGMYNGTWMIRPNFEKNKALLKDFIYADNQ